MTKANVLLQLDTDPQPSVFDSVVAIDAGAERLLRHGNVTPTNVTPLVHGVMFTRGPDELRHSAIFVGGSDVAAGEAVFQAVREAFFGPLRVSVMFDANGANTTAAAAVVLAGRHVPLNSASFAVLGGTGPVGQRVAQLLAGQGARVRVASRSRSRAEDVCKRLADLGSGTLEAVEWRDPQQAAEIVTDVDAVIAAGAASSVLISAETLRGAENLRLAIDLNAVPPTGIEGIQPTDMGVERGTQLHFGAIGVGGFKMKVHKAAIRRLFESNDQLLDAEEIYQLALSL